MKVVRAARFAGGTALVAGLYMVFWMSPGLAQDPAWAERAAWLAANRAVWAVGWWLWMLGIFAWMVLLVAFMYSYTPMHRITTMLQTGLVLIAAVFAIGCVLVWMNLLPEAGNVELAGMVDTLALSFLAAGLLMGGGVTAWIGVDLIRLHKLPWSWLAPGVVAGLCAVPSPFLLPWPFLLYAGLVSFLIWCGFLGSRRRFPEAYPEWRGL
jgi:hypothetical protein